MHALNVRVLYLPGELPPMSCSFKQLRRVEFILSRRKPKSLEVVVGRRPELPRCSRAFRVKVPFLPAFRSSPSPSAYLPACALQSRKAERIEEISSQRKSLESVFLILSCVPARRANIFMPWQLLSLRYILKFRLALAFS